MGSGLLWQVPAFALASWQIPDKFGLDREMPASGVGEANYQAIACRNNLAICGSPHPNPIDMRKLFELFLEPSFKLFIEQSLAHRFIQLHWD
jgi:hypothetical protein